MGVSPPSPRLMMPRRLPLLPKPLLLPTPLLLLHLIQTLLLFLPPHLLPTLPLRPRLPCRVPEQDPRLLEVPTRSTPTLLLALLLSSLAVPTLSTRLSRPLASRA